ARIWPGLALPVWISQAMRVVRTRVLPLPAPARISADWAGSVTAASCSGLRCSRSDIGAAAKPRFYKTRGSAGDFIVAQLPLVLQALRGRVGVGLAREARELHDVDALVVDLGRLQLGGVAGRADVLVGLQRRAGRFRRHDDLPLAAAARDAFARLGLGLGRPDLQLLGRNRRDRLRLVLLADVERQRLVHRDRRLAGRREIDLALDQADDLLVGGGLAPEVGAADAGGHRADRDGDVALAAELRERL